MTTDRTEPDDAENTTIAFYRALKAGMIIPAGTDDAGDLVYDLTEIGKVRARVLAPHFHVDPDTMTEAQAMALVTTIAAQIDDEPESALD